MHRSSARAGNMRHVHTSALLALVALFVVASASAQSDRPRDTARLIDEYRTSLGLPQLHYDNRLATAAQAHSDTMLAIDCFAHTCPGEPVAGQRALAAGYPSSGVGEIIARGMLMPVDAVAAWRGSPAHDEIMRGQWADVGCGVAGADGGIGSGRGPFWTCVFGNPGAPPWGGLPTLPPPGVTLTPRPPTPTPTPDPRGRLPAGYLMRVWLHDGSNTASDCRMAGTSCFRVIQADYDLLNLAPFDPWLVTDYLFYSYCGLNGVMCEWIRK